MSNAWIDDAFYRQPWVRSCGPLAAHIYLAGTNLIHHECRDAPTVTRAELRDEIPWAEITDGEFGSALERLAARDLVALGPDSVEFLRYAIEQENNAERKDRAARNRRIALEACRSRRRGPDGRMLPATHQRGAGQIQRDAGHHAGSDQRDAGLHAREHQRDAGSNQHDAGHDEQLADDANSHESSASSSRKRPATIQRDAGRDQRHAGLDAGSSSLLSYPVLSDPIRKKTRARARLDSPAPENAVAEAPKKPRSRKSADHGSGPKTIEDLSIEDLDVCAETHTEPQETRESQTLPDVVPTGDRVSQAIRSAKSKVPAESAADTIRRFAVEPLRHDDGQDRVWRYYALRFYAESGSLPTYPTRKDQLEAFNDRCRKLGPDEVIRRLAIYFDAPSFPLLDGGRDLKRFLEHFDRCATPNGKAGRRETTDRVIQLKAEWRERLASIDGANDALLPEIRNWLGASPNEPKNEVPAADTLIAERDRRRAEEVAKNGYYEW